MDSSASALIFVPSPFREEKPKVVRAELPVRTLMARNKL